MNLPRQCAAFIRTLVAISGLAVGLSPLAQATAHAQTERIVRVADFGGARFPLEATSGELSFAAQRIYLTDAGAGQRLVLVGDVRVRIGRYDFYAKRAAAWVEPVPGSGTGAVQVYVYFEELGRPDELATASGFAADRLPVKAIIIPDGGPNAGRTAGKLGGATVTGDLVLDRLPADSDPSAHRAFAERSEEALARSLGLSPPLPQPELKPILDSKFVAKRAEERAAWLAAGKPDLTTLPPMPVREQPVRLADGAAPTDGAPPAGSEATPRPSSRSASATAAAGGRQAAQSSQPVPRSAPRTSESSAISAGSPTDSTAPPSKSGAAPVPAKVATSAASGPPPARIGGSTEPIFVKDGTITLVPGNVTFVSGEDEDAVMATGGVAMQYAATNGRVLQMTAQRAVIFLGKGSAPGALTFGAGDVRGIYLEGDVIASDGQFTLRGPQIFYDVVRNKAVSIDSVFWTYDEQRRLPIYVRAKAIRQETATQFSAERAELTNSAFFEPELSLGASTVTITRQKVTTDSKGLDAKAEPTTTRTMMEGRDITARVMGVPVFYWPKYSGDPAHRPIKRLAFESFSGSGGAVKVAFDVYALMGRPQPKNFEFDILTDYYFERGLALGTRLGWKNPDGEGGLFAYGVLSDDGTDVLKPGSEIQREGDFRGVLLAEHRQKIDDRWTVVFEGAWLSDEAVIDAFFENLGENRREFTNRIAATRRDRHTALTLDAKGQFNDFISNEYLLQSQGYSVNKFPEAVYSRLGDDLLSRFPGSLTYFSEYRAGLMSMNFDDVEARDHGFNTNTLAERALGIDFDEKLGDVLAASGLTEDTVFRADTRHELAAKLNAGPVIITPFVVGRGTVYDQEFEDYAPGESSEGRLWSSAGVRASTTIQRVHDGVGSRIFDLHRLRHIIEPNAAIFVSGTTLEADSLPVYDENVENLADGTIMKIGVTQTFQTQRGGPGRWHNTDVLVLTTDFVDSSDDATNQGPIGRFIDYRPELSNPGDFFMGDLIWRATDAVAITGSTVYDFELNQQATSAAGILLRHAPNFTTAAEVRYLNAQDDTLITLGTQYRLTSKYSVFMGADYDVDESGFQNTAFEVRRRFQSMELGINISYNDITGESGFGFVFRPYGTGDGGRISGLGSSRPSAASSNLGY